jgi:hypothetical protein
MDMDNLDTEKYGEVGAYFYTKVAFKYLFPDEREYGPFHFEPAQEAPSEGDGEENDEDNYEEDDDADKDVDVFVVKSEAVSVPVLPEATQVALINKLREGPRSTQDAGGSIPGADENVDQILSSNVATVSQKSWKSRVLREQIQYRFFFFVC